MSQSRTAKVWITVALLVVIGAALVALTSEIPSWPAWLKRLPRYDLAGRVLAKGGKPLTVPASVYIISATPKSGASTVGASSYPDCAKRAHTDEQGAFKIKALDGELNYRLLVAASGYQPKYQGKVDPMKPKPVKITLDPIKAADAPPERTLHGRVVNKNGEPLEGAVVDVQSVSKKDGSEWWGGFGGIDELAVTDGKGEFVLTSKDPFNMLTVKVSARMYADKQFNHLAGGAEPHELTMSKGATLTGRVLAKGEPLAPCSVGLNGAERNMEQYLGHYEIPTDKHGAFSFANLPPDADFEIYTLMNKASGTIMRQRIHTGKDGETTTVGDLAMGPAYQVAGQVVLSDGKPVPNKTRLTISREDAWDSMQVPVEKDGKFHTAGIPSDIVSLSLRVRGYHLSTRNFSMDRMNPWQLSGRVDHDTTDLVILLDKGPETQPDYSNADPESWRIREKPLHGTEGAAPDHSSDWLVSGRVFDSESRLPVGEFHITPGDTGGFQGPAWSTSGAVDASNGVYRVYINKHTSQPMVKVEADGYLPQSATLLPGDTTNMDFTLKKGSGPMGSVFKPDGQPAADATVILATDGFNQGGLNEHGELDTYFNKSGLAHVDAKGRFSFKPLLGAKYIVAASPDGFVSVSVDRLATNSRITLEPYGKITGTLKRASGPGTNEILDVALAGADVPNINLQTHSDTDASGHFEFENVPPGRLQISYRETMGTGRGWMNQRLQEVELQPGQTLVTNLTAPDRTATARAQVYQQPEPPKLVAGAEVKGIVLSPDGTPAANTDVALQVPGVYLAMGKGSFAENGMRSEGFRTSTATDGSFTLPMYENTLSVVAVNEDGVAQVPVAQLRKSPQITLQKWGQIQGVLRVGCRIGSNETLTVNLGGRGWAMMGCRDGNKTNLPPLNLDYRASQVRTDNQGRFAMLFVPPGSLVISRQVSAGRGSWMASQIATVEVNPGETVVTNIGGTGRTVIGRIKFADGAKPDLQGGMVRINTPISKLLQKANQMKTDEERQKFYTSDEFQEAAKDSRTYSATVHADGSFRVEDMEPGKYEISFQQRFLSYNNTTYTVFNSTEDRILAKAKNKDDDSAVDWGNVELTKTTMPVQMAARKK